MNTAIKLIELFLPLIIEMIKSNHPEKTSCEHHEIIKKILDENIKKLQEK